MAHLNRALDQAPEELALRLIGIEVLLRAGLWWEAQAALKPLRSRYPDDARLRWLEWQALVLHPQPDRATVEAALDDLADVVLDDDQAVRGLSLKARLLARVGRLEEAQASHAGAIAAAGTAPAWIQAESHYCHGLTCLAAGDQLVACQAFWAATEVRPASYITQQAKQRLQAVLAELDDHSVMQPFATLHERIRALKKLHKDSVTLAGFDLYRQGLAAAWVPGSRPTETRLATYRLDEILPENARALDVSAEQGFLLLGLAERLAHGEGLDPKPFNTELGMAAAETLGIEHIRLSNQSLEGFKSKKPFDLILACGAHASSELGAEALGRLLYALCAPGGVVLLESRGIRSTQEVEPEFAENAAVIAGVGFHVERKDYLCDDGINKREFRVLRRQS
ncbi:class I SAM-dependent methyltransferase [Halomonas sp. BC04]|uniref:class I SAM-dependent methyltransferase n=1 Tax=Halomonas sp. BC04 TaxID=1403540 RepID=UPI0003ED6F10|nr:SAM-dependent methyltransferase [Halomonas sp. BC04]EWH00826.1 hypothetical protein Q427_17380 [Halomonas sp. BC04]